MLSCLVANRFQLNKEARRGEGGPGGLVKMQGVGEVGGRRRRRDAGSWTGRVDSLTMFFQRAVAERA